MILASSKYAKDKVSDIGKVHAIFTFIISIVQITICGLFQSIELKGKAFSI